MRHSANALWEDEDNKEQDDEKEENDKEEENEQDGEENEQDEDENEQDREENDEEQEEYYNQCIGNRHLQKPQNNIEKYSTQETPIDEHVNFLISLNNSDYSRRRMLLLNATNPEMEFLCECVDNIYLKNVPINPKEIENLRPYRHIFRILRNFQIPISRRREIILQNDRFVSLIVFTILRAFRNCYTN